MRVSTISPHPVSWEKPPPVYPDEAIRNGLEGTVKLRLLFAKTGRVVRVEIVESSGHSILDDSVIETVRTWNGVPANSNGIPIESAEIMPVRFQLNARC